MGHAALRWRHRAKVAATLRPYNTLKAHGTQGLQLEQIGKLPQRDWERNVHISPTWTPCNLVGYTFWTRDTRAVLALWSAAPRQALFSCVPIPGAGEGGIGEAVRTADGTRLLNHRR